MENYSQLKKVQKQDTIIKKIVDSYFAIMLQLLKNKSIDQLWACVLIFIMFSQVFAGLFERHIFNWKDEMLLESFQGFCEYIRIVEAINMSKSAIYYWIVFYFAIAYLFIIAVLLVYLHYSLNHVQFYFESIVQALRYLLIISYSILFLPFFEIFISIFHCDADTGYHYLVKSMECYQTSHAILCFVAIIGLFELILLNVVIALLYNETQPVKEDALSRLDSNFEILMLIYRILIGTLSQYCLSNFCSWIIIAVSLISSMYFLYQYYKYLPYYNNFVSIFFGCMIGIYFWISVNALLSEFFEISGHIVVILIGTPIVCQLIISMRLNRIESLMTQTTEQMKSDIDSLNQIILLQDWLRESGETSDIDKEMKVKGIITLHVSECEAEDCVCKNIDDLYDHSNDRYLCTKTINDLHSNQVFVNHFNKQLYAWALNKFISSPSIHISFAFYQFSVMKNIHAALHELKIAAKKRPTIQQQFTIFRYQHIIELFVQKESDKMKHIYEQLTNVKEFEKLFQDMQKQIEKVCNYQVEFWTHLTTVVPDLNTLDDLNNKIYNSSSEADKLWKSLCEINPHYPQALTLYGEYLTFIRNNQQAGKDYFDRAHNVDFAQKSVQDHIKRSEILFSEDSTVVHISGIRESSGRILKVSQGLFKCFGFSKQEVIGHNVNTLMPTLFGDKHNDFLENYYRTGRANIFNRERQLFAQNRTGYCFTMKLLIKQMPSLKEDVQYVGMIKPISTDYEYILTDMQGNIDSFTSGIGSMLSLNPQLFKDQLSVNIQIIAPELISIFEYRRAFNARDKSANQGDPTNYRNYYRRPSFNTFQYGGSKFLSNNKYSVPGGDQLNFIVPNNFATIIKSEKPAKSNRTQGKKKGDESSLQHQGITQNQPNKFLKSAPFREFLKYLSKGKTYVKKAPDLQKLLTCKEYRECDVKKNVNIEIREWSIALGNNESKGLKLLLFMIAKNQQEKRQQDLQSFDGPANNQGMSNPLMNQHNLSYAAAFGQTLQKSTTLDNQQNDFASQGTLVQRSIQNSQKYTKNAIADLPPTKKNVTNASHQNPLGSSFHSSGLSGRIQNNQFGNKQSLQQSNIQTPQLMQAVSFLEIDQQQLQNANQQQDQPQSYKDENNLQNDSNALSPLKPIKQQNQTKIFMNSNPNQKNQYDFYDDNKLKLLSDRAKDPNAIDLNDALFERQETDEQEEDNEHEIDTDRIDVKKEIVLNDEIKQNTKSFEDNYVKSDSKLSLKLESKVLGAQQQQPLTMQSHEMNSMRGGINYSNNQGVVGQIQNHNGAVNINSVYDSHQSSKNFNQEEQKNQLKHKPITEKIEQSKDDDEGAEDEGYEDDEDMEDGDDDEFEDGDEMDEDDDSLEGDFDENGEGRRNNKVADGQMSDEGSHHGSDDELIQSQGQSRRGMGNRKNGGNNGMRNEYYSSGQNSKNLNNNNGNNNQNIQNQLQNSSITQQQPPDKKIKMHDYTRIVTNPRYKAFDDETCGSAYFNECNCSERELDIRDMIKKNQATKKRREKRRNKRKEEEEKKIQSGGVTTGPGTDDATQNQSDLEKNSKTDDKGKSNQDEDDSKSKSKSGGHRVKKMRNRRKESNSGSESKSKSRSRVSESGSEEQKGEKTEDDDDDMDDDEGDDKHRMLQRDHDQLNDEGEVSSIASSQQSQARTFFSLRAAIDEKFVPMQIKNLRYVANIVWLLILLLAIVYYVIQLTLFSDIQDYISIIINSEKRINDIMKMNLQLSSLMLINEGILQKENYLFPDKNQYIQTLISQFVNSTTELKNSQTLLSLQTSSLSESSRISINPEDVILQFESVPQLPSTFSYSIWEAIMQIVVHAYKLAESPLEIVHTNPDVQFITSNCMNSVMSALQESTNAIVSESDRARDTNINVFMYLLVAVSCSLMLSMGFLMPVIRKAKYNKQEVFELFTHKKIEKCIDDQLKKCRWFIQKYQSQAESQTFEVEMQDNMVEENTHIPEKEMKADDDKQSEYMKNYKKQKKKWKRINISFGSLMLKFSVVVLLIEGFFMFNFFISKQFLGQVQYLTKELRLLISRQPSNSFILLLEKELIYSNNSAQFLYEDVNSVLTRSFSTQYSETQELLSQFAQNYDYHSTRYNTDFNSIIYSDVCGALSFDIEFSAYSQQGGFNLNSTLENTPITKSQCQAFNGGILQKGVYNSEVKFWTQLQQLYNDFFGSNRTLTDIKAFLNHAKLIQSERMSQQYFETSHWHLVDVLKNDIDKFFEQEFSVYQVAFIFFILYILVMYFLIWRIFIKHLVEELWKAKSVLSVLPVEICFRIEEIRTFIYQNSSTFTGANG